MMFHALYITKQTEIFPKYLMKNNSVTNFFPECL